MSVHLHWNTHKVMQLASIGLSLEEIGGVLGCSDRLLQLRFSAALRKGWAHRNANLRKLQWQSAQRGSPAMLIWLGKQWLGQRERPELSPQHDSLKRLLDAFTRRYERIKGKDSAV